MSASSYARHTIDIVDRKVVASFMKQIAVIFLALILSGCTAPASSQSQIQTCLDFLQSYGIEAEPEPIEESVLVIPQEFDPVYEHYEELVAKDGFTLIPYRGKQVTRLTFPVTNYPGREDVRANVLLYQGSVIAGDLSTVSLYGFMESFSDFPA